MVQTPRYAVDNFYLLTVPYNIPALPFAIRMLFQHLFEIRRIRFYQIIQRQDDLRVNHGLRAARLLQPVCQYHIRQFISCANGAENANYTRILINASVPFINQLIQFASPAILDCFNTPVVRLSIADAKLLHYFFIKISKLQPDAPDFTYAAKALLLNILSNCLPLPAHRVKTAVSIQWLWSKLLKRQHHISSTITTQKYPSKTLLAWYTSAKYISTGFLKNTWASHRTNISTAFD